MSSLFCEGCVVAAAAVVARLRFAVENVPAKGSPWFLIGQESYSPKKILQRPGESRPILTGELGRSSGGPASIKNTWGWPSRRSAARLVADISLCSDKHSVIKSSEKKCEVWALVVLHGSTLKWQETVSLDRRRRSGRCIWGRVRVGGQFCCRRRERGVGNGTCFCLHFTPFLMVPF